MSNFILLHSHIYKKGVLSFYFAYKCEDIVSSYSYKKIFERELSLVNNFKKYSLKFFNHIFLFNCQKKHQYIQLARIKAQTILISYLNFPPMDCLDYHIHKKGYNAFAPRIYLHLDFVTWRNVSSFSSDLQRQVKNSIDWLTPITIFIY